MYGELILGMQRPWDSPCYLQTSTGVGVVWQVIGSGSMFLLCWELYHVAQSLVPLQEFGILSC